MSTSDVRPLPARPSRPPRRNAWLQMLRPPNLFTVPGDPVTGGLLAIAGAGMPVEAEAWRLTLVAAASILLYAGGLLQNDFFDLAEDRLQRPQRPLPAAQANPRAVIVAAFAVAALGIVLGFGASVASGLVAAALLVCMTAYNAGAKRVPLVGPVLMGSCRGLSLLVGAGVLGWAGLGMPAVLISACSLLLLIAAITLIASRETEAVQVGPRRWAPGLIVAVGLGLLWGLLPRAGGISWMAAIPAAWAVAWMVYCANWLQGQPEPRVVQRTIGQFISGLLFVQAALAGLAGPGGLAVAAGLVLAWPFSRRVARRFYAS